MVAHAGLAEPSLRLLRAVVADGGTVARFPAKIAVVVPGSGCEYWTSAISGRGHGRFWIAEVAGRDVVVIAHRFAWALERGVNALEQVPVLGHRCDNPLCQRIGDGHVMASSHWLNRREWALRRHTIGGVLRDTRGARGRAGALRDAVRREPTARKAGEAALARVAARWGQPSGPRCWGRADLSSACGTNTRVGHRLPDHRTAAVRDKCGLPPGQLVAADHGSAETSLDHSNVYLLIAGTYAPIVVLGLPDPQRTLLLWGIWIGAVAGVLFRCFWTHAPRALYTVLYIVLGWCLAPVFGTLAQHAGPAVAALVITGGMPYTLGAVVYAAKRPNPSPVWFVFHEVFHSFTIAAWTAQYVATALLIFQLR